MNARAQRIATSLGLAAVVAAVCLALAPAWLPAQTTPLKTCCIAGDYRGSQTPDPLPNCPVPKPELFSMTIQQALGCGSEVWGRITDASGHVNQFRGTVRQGLRGCCELVGSFGDPKRPGHVVAFKGTLCQQLGKWHATGTFTETNGGDPCKKGGVWRIDQN